MTSLVYTHLLTTAMLLSLGMLVYYLLFWRSTYLRLNRIILWGFWITALVAPAIHLPEAWTIWQKMQAIPASAKLILPSPNTVKTDDLAANNTGNPINIPAETQLVDETKFLPKTQPLPPFNTWLSSLYLLGCGVLSIRFLIQLLSLWKLYHSARIESRGSYQLAVCPRALPPFSFGRTIFVSEELYHSPKLNMVLTHELVHVQQKHTWDIVLAELTLIVQWFNPAAWLYRRFVEINLEYLADRQVLLQDWDKKNYQLSLLEWTYGGFSNRLSTAYNFSPLKERIMMMNKKPSPKWYTLCYALVLFTLPLLPVLNQPRLEKDGQKTSEPVKAKLDGHSVGRVFPLSWHRSVEKPVLKQVKKLDLQTQQVETDQIDTIIKPANNITSILVVVDLDISREELERLANTPLPWGKKLRYTTDASGRLKSLIFETPNINSCSIASGENSEFPLVIFGTENSCSTRNFDFNTLKQIQHAKEYQNSLIITGGIPLDQQGFEAYKAKILSNQNNAYLRRLINLEANRWQEDIEDGRMVFEGPISDEGLKNVLTRVNRCLKAEKELSVSINNGPEQADMPDLASLKITRLEMHLKSKQYYITGTTNVYRTEWLGMRVNIFTE